MGFNIQADSIIQTLWDSLRPKSFSYDVTKDSETGEYIPVEPGLLVTLDLRVFHGDQYQRSALVRFVLTANTSVFFHSSPEYIRSEEIPANAWKNSSNHDSCWRSDGMLPLSQLHFQFCEEMNKEITGQGFSALAPREFSQFCTLGALGSKPWEFVTVSHRRIPTEHYRRELLSLENASTGDHR